MLTVAQQRAARHDNVELRLGEATEIPVNDGWADRAFSVQVLEYVPDTTKALAELYRIVRPGGRVVIWDIDWDPLSWHSADPERMRRVMLAWDEHLAEPSLPRILPAALRDAGFEDIRTEGYAFVNTDAGPDSYSGAVMSLMADFVPGRGGVTTEEAQAWLAEQEDLSAKGGYFFSIVQFCFTAAKP